MGKKKQTLNNSPRCKKCNSALTYIRIGVKQRVCRSCGYIENIGDKNE